MGATPKALRAAPPRRFENYILARSTAPTVNLANVPDSLFTPCSPGAAEVGFQDPGVGYTDDGLSIPIDIGFLFQIDNITYRKFVVCTNGWMALVDPTTGAFTSSEVLNNAVWINSAIKTSFTSQAVLLCPWFDDLRNVAFDPSQTLGLLSTTKIDRIRKGLETPPTVTNATQNSVKFFRDVRSSRGRRLIVRWNSLSDFSNPNTILRFEVILYENGTIEYRYAPRANINLFNNPSSPEDATIGIFMPNGTNRFRDFSYGLGYRDGERQQFRYGGAVVTGSYTDTADSNTANYTCNLKPFVHWPGLAGAGSMFTFMPPVNRRKVLPRAQSAKAASRLTLPTVARTGDARRGNDPISFDDRRAAVFIDILSSSGRLVNYPTTLQRFFGDSEPNIVFRQDLFAGDFEFTASVIKDVVDQFILDDVPRSIEPFSEYKLFENDPANDDDVFFTSGSSIDALGDGLSQPLKAKTQIRLSLPVNYNTALFGTASTIHYYNRRAGAWEVPQNASYTIGNASSTNDSGKTKGDMVPDRTPDSVALRIIEDQRGFGPIGNCLSSGTHTRSGNGDQSDASIGAPYSALNVTTALNKSYGKSVSVNEDYRASIDEVFQLPINQPFLIERAVIEIPFAAGDGWFQDKTMCLSTLENNPGGGFDFGGPALTVALFNQTIAGSLSRRDLILTGTITHANDNVDELVFSAFPPISSTFQIRPRGFLAYNAVPGAVITPASSSTAGWSFTGSVGVRCEAQVSNGIIARLELAMTSSDIQANKSGVIDVFNTSQITLGNQITNHYSQSCYIAYVNNFGRGGSGFDPSGRSIFGKEFTTNQQLTKQGKIANPFYLTGTSGGAASPTFNGIPAQFVQAITAGSTFKFEMALPLEGYLPSPYLVTPGDTLILAVSKTRPVFMGSQAPQPRTSGSIQHDVQLISGSVNIVLYGSLLKEGKEFHDTLNQPLASDAVHEIVVGNDPVIDQFETDYRELFVSGNYDDFVDGNLISRITRPDGRNVFVTGSVIGSKVATNVLSRGSRGRIFSKHNARSAPVPGTSEFDFSTSMAFRLQPYFEKAGTVRLSQAVDATERFWDSLLPAVNQCFLANGAGIFMLRTATIGNPATVDQRIGFLWFDYQLPAWFPTWGKLLDGIWTKAFPYEPRYSTIPRQQFIEKSFIANYEVDFFGSYPSYQPGVFTIAPRPLTGFFFGPVGARQPSNPPIEPTHVNPTTDPLFNGVSPYDFRYHNYLFSCDVDLQSNLTSSAGVADVTKALFGFGDINNMISTSLGTNTTFGTNHYVDSRVKYFDANNWGAWFSPGPVIRGWKYGIYNGLPTFSKAYFRQDHFGQLRDMLEQRPLTKYYQSSEKTTTSTILNFRQGTTPSAVTVKFVDAAGKLTKPENTWSQNLSFEATSSVPYFDGETRNRTDINTNTLNANIIAFKTNQFGQVTL